jgi:putative ATP-binding cassette transporter
MTTPNGTTNGARSMRETWRRFIAAISNFAGSEVRGQAAVLFAGLLGLLVAISGLNVLNSYVGRDFMTAIEHRDRADFVREAVIYVIVFGASTAAAVLYSFCEQRMGLLWRGWLTKRLVGFYLAEHTFYRLASDDALSNPDQRIAEDVRTFVAMTLSLSLLLLNGTMTVLAFSGVLWSISRTLFVVGLVYAAVGSLLTVLLGRRLVDLNYRQSDREADFRAALIHVREHAEGVALLQREGELTTRLVERIDALVANSRRIIAVNRDLGFFTTGYNYMIQLIPALIVAPLFIRGHAEFGIITQSAMAFAHLLGAFSLVVTQFQAISSYAAVLARLNALVEAFRPVAAPAGLTVVEDDSRVAWEHLTLRTPRESEVVVQDLSMSIPYGTRVVIASDDPVVRGALMRATAGLWNDVDGRIVRPSLERIAFLPERPYVPPGTLREVVSADGGQPPASDDEIRAVLAGLGAEAIMARTEGLDVEHDWHRILTPREQALLSVAHLALDRPRFAFVDNLARTIGAEHLAPVLRLFTERGITYVAMTGEDAVAPCDVVLSLAGGGRWSVRSGCPEPAAVGGQTA